MRCLMDCEVIAYYNLYDVLRCMIPAAWRWQSQFGGNIIVSSDYCDSNEGLLHVNELERVPIHFY